MSKRKTLAEETNPSTDDEDRSKKRAVYTDITRESNDNDHTTVSHQTEGMEYHTSEARRTSQTLQIVDVIGNMPVNIPETLILDQGLVAVTDMATERFQSGPKMQEGDDLSEDGLEQTQQLLNLAKSRVAAAIAHIIDVEANMDAVRADLEAARKHVKDQDDAVDTIKSNIELQKLKIQMLENDGNSSCDTNLQATVAKLKSSIMNYECDLAIAMSRLNRAKKKRAYAEQELADAERSHTKAREMFANAQKSRIELANLMPPPQWIELHYEASPLSQDDIDQGLRHHDIPRVSLSRHDAEASGLSDTMISRHRFSRHAVSAYIADYASRKPWTSRTDVDNNLTGHPFNHIIDMVCRIAWMTTNRSLTQGSTSRQPRVDVSVHHPGFPAIVVAEVESAGETLGDAIERLNYKFHRGVLTYKSDLRWIIGIVMGSSQVVFLNLHLDTNRFTQLDSFSLENPEECLKSVHAAINVARWCNWVHESELVYPTTLHPYQPLSRTRCTLTFTPPCIRKVIKEGNWTKKLQTFYKAIANAPGAIPYFEWATRVTKRGSELDLTLLPFGVTRTPGTLNELRSALRCVLIALSALHAKKWCHLDVRWHNVVWCADDNWVLIDAEFAQPFGAAMPYALRLGVRDPGTIEVDAAADLYCVGHMLGDMAGLGEPHAQSLREALLGQDASVPRHMRTAEWALRHAFFTADAEAMDV